MDIRTKDGIVLRGIPDGTPEDQIKERIYKIRAERGLASPSVDVQPMDFSPTDGMSNSQKFFAGVGKGMTDIGRGIGQMVGLVSDADVAESRNLDAPLMDSTSGSIGNFVGQASLAAPTALIPGANTYAGASLIGAGIGALQPVTKDESRLTNVGLGAAGGAIGQKVGNVIASKLGGMPYAKAQASAKGGSSASGASISANPSIYASGGGAGYGYVGDDISRGLNPAQQRVLATGQELGFKATPGQASGSRALQQFEAKLESQPMTSGTFNQIKENNQRILNRIAAKSIGETSDTLDSVTLGQAQERLGNVYKMVADDKVRAIDPDQFLAKLSNVEGEFEGMVKLSDNGLVKKFLNYASEGGATGKQLQDLASKLGKASSNQMTSAQGDRALGMALYQVKDHVDELLQSGLSGKTLKTFAEARSQYRNLMLLTQRQGVVNPSSGNVQGNALASVLQQKDRGGFLFDKNTSDLYEAARFAQAFRPIVGDSGTATRSMVQSPMDFLVSLPFNVATKAYTSGPVVNASAGYGNIMRNGLVDPKNLKYVPQTFGLLGGLSVQ